MAEPIDTKGSWWQTLALMLRISIEADRLRSALAVLTAVAQMASAPLLAIGLRRLADGIAAASTNDALRGAVTMLAVLAVQRLATHASFNVRVRLKEHTQLHLDAVIMAMTAGIPGLEHHERADYLDEVELIRAERSYLANPFNPISWSVASTVQIATVLALLSGISPWLALLPLAGIPTAIVTARLESGAIDLRERHAEPSRRQRHLLELATEVPAAKEVRLSRLGATLLARRRAGFDALEADEVAFARHKAGWTALGVACFASGYAAAVAVAVHLAEQGRIAVGGVVLVLSLGAQIDGQVAEMAENLAWFQRTHRAVQRLGWFQAHAEAAARAVAPLEPVAVPDRIERALTFEGLSFTYPGTDRPVLAGVDLTIPAGTTVAIVGENGAASTSRPPARSASTASRSRRSTSPSGVVTSPPASRTSPASSSSPVRSSASATSTRGWTTRRSSPRWTAPRRHRWSRPSPTPSTPSWDASSRAASTCRSGSGRSWQWVGR
jgi:ATP-binding cassette subfamily B protein